MVPSPEQRHQQGDVQPSNQKAEILKFPGKQEEQPNPAVTNEMQAKEAARQKRYEAAQTRVKARKKAEDAARIKEIRQKIERQKKTDDQIADEVIAASRKRALREMDAKKARGEWTQVEMDTASAEAALAGKEAEFTGGEPGGVSRLPSSKEVPAPTPAPPKKKVGFLGRIFGRGKENT